MFLKGPHDAFNFGDDAIFISILYKFKDLYDIILKEYILAYKSLRGGS